MSTLGSFYFRACQAFVSNLWSSSVTIACHLWKVWLCRYQYSSNFTTLRASFGTLQASVKRYSAIIAVVARNTLPSIYRGLSHTANPFFSASASTSDYLVLSPPPLPFSTLRPLISSATQPGNIFQVIPDEVLVQRSWKSLKVDEYQYSQLPYFLME